MSVFDINEQLELITHQKLIEDGWMRVPVGGISQDVCWPIYGRYVKDFNKGITSCDLIATIDYDQRLIYELRIYDNVMNSVRCNYIKVTYIDGLKILLHKYGCI